MSWKIDGADIAPTYDVDSGAVDRDPPRLVKYTETIEISSGAELVAFLRDQAKKATTHAPHALRLPNLGELVRYHDYVGIVIGLDVTERAVKVFFIDGDMDVVRSWGKVDTGAVRPIPESEAIAIGLPAPRLRSDDDYEDASRLISGSIFRGFGR